MPRGCRLYRHLRTGLVLLCSLHTLPRRCAVFTSLLTAPRRQCRSAQSALLLRLTKLGTYGALIAVYVASIVVTAIVKIQPCCWRNAIGASSIECVAAAVTLFISDRQHRCASHSSAWVTSWLGTTCILDLANVRTQWLTPGNAALAAIYTVTTSLKAVCLLLENFEIPRAYATAFSSSPEERASPLNLVVFAWIWPLLRRGYRRVLSLDNLVAISGNLKTDQSLDPVPLKRRHKTLFMDIVHDMPGAFFAPVIARFFLMGFSLSQPFLVYTTLKYTVSSFAAKDDTKGSLLIFAYVLVFGGFAVANALYWYLVLRLKLKVRSRLIELIYDCTYKSSGSAANRAATSLITNDVEAAMMGFDVFHENWASIVQIAAAVAILSSYIGWACAGPIAACVVCLLVTVPVVIFIDPTMAGWNASAADRVIVTSAVLRQLTEVRLLGLGNIAFSLIRRYRRKEIVASTRFRRLLFLIIIFSQAPLALCPLVTLAFYAIKLNSSSGGSFLFAVNAFTALNLIGLIVIPFGILLQSLPIFGAGQACLARLEQYVDAARKIEKTTRNVGFSVRTEGNALEVEDVSLGWIEDSAVVKNITFNVAGGEFLAILGPVGSGKSTILAGLLDLTTQSSGRISRASLRVSVCPQTPWILSGTVRDNILCGRAFDQTWFDEVIKACALADDLERWAHGDRHDVGNDGSSISGGQRQRVALARAVYARNSLVFLDEPTGGLDPDSAFHIQTELFGPSGLFRRQGSTVVVITNAAELVKLTDQTLLLAKGGVVAGQGPTKDILATTRHEMHNLTALHELETRKSAVHQTDFAGMIEDSGQGVLALERENANRKAGDWSIYWYYFRATGRVNSMAFLLGAVTAAAAWQGGVAWIKEWSEDLIRGDAHSTGYFVGIYAAISGLAGIGLMANAGSAMVLMVSRGSWNFHTVLLQGVAQASASHFSAIDAGITINRFIQDLRLIDWELPLAMVNAVDYACICVTQAVVIAIASRYMAIAIVIVIAILWVLQRFYLRTSRQLRLLDIEAKAPLYTNFHETIQGIPSIRAYGEDLGRLLLEKQRVAANNSQQPLFLLGVVQKWLSLVVDLVVTCLATVLITLVVKDPSPGAIASLGAGLVNLTLFNQYLTSVIRFWTELENALGAISRIKGFSAKTPVATGGCVQDASQPDRIDAVSLENLSQAVEVDIVFDGVSAYHDMGANVSVGGNVRAPALDDVSLSIPAGSKIGIVGRSGSGKSTLLSCMSRILPLRQGTIRFNGVDIATLDQEVVQTGLICVTQSFFFFPNLTLRDNLDSGAMPLGEQPSSEAVGENDEQIIAVLEMLEMWSAAEERGGLAATFDPAAWSTGQVRLLNLARAVLKNRRRLRRRHASGAGWKVLLLDEVTGNIDRQTAALMQRVVREEFADYTVIAIEHVLEDVMQNLDRIVRMDQGRIVGDGKPTDMVNI